jgi:hypothetical protein
VLVFVSVIKFPSLILSTIESEDWFCLDDCTNDSEGVVIVSVIRIIIITKKRCLENLIYQLDFKC